MKRRAAPRPVDKKSNQRRVVVGLAVVIFAFVGNVAFWIGTGAEEHQTAAIILGVVLVITLASVAYGRRRGTV